MAFRMTMRIGEDGVGRRLAGMVAALAPSERRGLLEDVGQVLVSGAKRHIDEQHGPEGQVWPPTRRGGQMLRDTGLLQRSITYEVRGDTVVVGSSRVYAAVHQFGATIRPKRGKFLALPLPGVARGARPRDFRDTFVAAGGGELAVTKSGRTRVMKRQTFEEFEAGPGDPSASSGQAGSGRRAIIFQRTATGVRPLFLLLASVTVPARPYVGLGPWERRHVGQVVRRRVLGEGAP